MPNIHMVGFEASEYRRLKDIIDQAMQILGLGNDAVTTYVQALVSFCDGKNTPAPYISISSTKPEELLDIKEILQALDIGVDCEICPILLNFEEAGDMHADVISPYHDERQVVIQGKVVEDKMCPPGHAFCKACGYVAPLNRFKAHDSCPNTRLPNRCPNPGAWNFEG